MARKDALRLALSKLFASAGLQTLRSDVVPQGQIWCLESIAWEINLATSGGNTRARLYVDGHGEKVDFEEQDAPAADTLYTYSDVQYLYPGERLALDIDQAQAGTTARMKVVGYIEYPKEG